MGTDLSKRNASGCLDITWLVRDSASAMSKIQEPHDGLFKRVFSNTEHARAELLTVLPAALTEVMDLSSLEHCSGSFVDKELQKAFTDLLFSVSIGGEEGFAYVLIEHQSRVDRWMPLRLWEYVGKIWQWYVKDNPGASRLPVVIPVVIHHSASSWSSADNIDALIAVPPAMRDVLSDKLARLGYYVDDLTVHHDDELHARLMAGLPRLALWALKNARHEQNFIAKMRDWARLFLEVHRAENGVQSLAVVLRYILQVSDATPDQVEEFAADIGASEAYMTGAEILQQRDRSKILLELLRERFGEVPPPAVERIKQADPEQLRCWLRLVVRADSLDEVLNGTANDNHPAN